MTAAALRRPGEWRGELGTAAAGADAKRLGCAGLSAAALLSRGNMCVNIVACASRGGATAARRRKTVGCRLGSSQQGEQCLRASARGEVQGTRKSRGHHRASSAAAAAPGVRAARVDGGAPHFRARPRDLPPVHAHPGRPMPQPEFRRWHTQRFTGDSHRRAESNRLHELRRKRQRAGWKTG